MARIDLAHALLGHRLVSVQNRFSPAFQETRPTLDRCARARARLPPVEPARRRLAQRGRRPERPEAARRRADGPFHTLARERGVSPQQVALAWHLAQSPVVVPIPGARRPASIQNSAAAAEPALSDAELARLVA